MFRRKVPIAVLLICGTASTAFAAPEVYTIEPGHTYPAFQASHQGVSHWLGKFDKTSGKVWLDLEHKTGKVDITVDTSSINFGLPLLDKIMQGADYFDVAQYPTATYKANSIIFDKKGEPSVVDGQLTLHGVTKPVKLKVVDFICKPNPMLGREVCGGDWTADFDRKDFGMTHGVEGDSTVHMIIQVEAVKGDTLPKMGPPPGANGPPPGGPPPGAGALPPGAPPPGAAPPGSQ